MTGSLNPGATVELPAQTGHYVNRVLRLSAGDALIVFNSDGAFHASLTSIRGTRAVVHVGEALDMTTESPLGTRLVQGLCRGPRMDYCVQKATELGVHRITPVVTERCVVRLSGARAAKRTAHWQSVATSACEQSGRTQVPVVDAPISFDALLDDGPAGLVVFDADRGAGFANWSAPSDGITLVIGPEGGLTSCEIDRLAAAGARRWRLGPRVLRTETAGVVALALCQTRFGDLAD